MVDRVLLTHCKLKVLLPCLSCDFVLRTTVLSSVCVKLAIGAQNAFLQKDSK